MVFRIQEHVMGTRMQASPMRARAYMCSLHVALYNNFTDVLVCAAYNKTVQHLYLHIRTALVL